MEEKEVVFELKKLRVFKPDKNFVKRAKKEILREKFSPFLLFPIFGAAFLLLAIVFYQNFQLEKALKIEILALKPVQNQKFIGQKNLSPLESPQKNLVKNKVSREKVQKAIEKLQEKSFATQISTSTEKDFDKEYLQKLSKVLIEEMEGQNPEVAQKMKEAFEKEDFQEVVDLYLKVQNNQSNE